jgi:membrane protease subunit (stomatin/prohibitin family)
MSSDYFDFANKPKGILPFHNYGIYSYPIEEHLSECVNYSNSNDFHFAVSEIHQHHFETIVDAIKGKVEKNLAYQ